MGGEQKKCNFSDEIMKLSRILILLCGLFVCFQVLAFGIQDFDDTTGGRDAFEFIFHDRYVCSHSFYRDRMFANLILSKSFCT